MPPIKVITFAGLSNLPLLAAEARGLFDSYDIDVELCYAGNSGEQRAGLAEGRYDIAFGAVDNAVAQIDAGEVDAIIVCGGDGGLNQLCVTPEIGSISDIRGKAVAVDAPHTAYALVLYEMLRVHGLARGIDYEVRPVGSTRHRIEAMSRGDGVVAALLTPPFSFDAEQAGAIRCLEAPGKLIGCYQGNGVWVRRAWALAHADQLIAFLAALIAGARRALEPRHRDEVVALLSRKLSTTTDIAARCLEFATRTGEGGIERDLALDHEGFATTLALRAGFADTPVPRSVDHERYLDETYYLQALNALATA